MSLILPPTYVKHSCSSYLLAGEDWWGVEFLLLCGKHISPDPKENNAALSYNYRPFSRGPLYVSNSQVELSAWKSHADAKGYVQH